MHQLLQGSDLYPRWSQVQYKLFLVIFSNTSSVKMMPIPIEYFIWYLNKLNRKLCTALDFNITTGCIGQSCCSSEPISCDIKSKNACVEGPTVYIWYNRGPTTSDIIKHSQVIHKREDFLFSICGNCFFTQYEVHLSFWSQTQPLKYINSLCLIKLLLNTDYFPVQLTVFRVDAYFGFHIDIW